jgi:hypothetical protein
MLAQVEKRWYQSKKFIAFLIMEMVFAALVVCTLRWQAELGWPIAGFLTSIIFCMGFIALAFNGKQAMVDMYVRGMAFGGKVPFKFKQKIHGTFGAIGEQMDEDKAANPNDTTREIINKTKDDDCKYGKDWEE